MLQLAGKVPRVLGLPRSRVSGVAFGRVKIALFARAATRPDGACLPNSHRLRISNGRCDRQIGASWSPQVIPPLPPVGIFRLPGPGP